MISRKEGIPVNHMTLEYAGHKLQDYVPLSTYKVTGPDALILTVEDTGDDDDDSLMSDLSDPYAEAVTQPETTHENMSSQPKTSCKTQSPRRTGTGVVDEVVDEKDEAASHAAVVRELLAK